MFLAELKDAMAAGAPALAHHMDLYAQDFFDDFGHRHVLDRVKGRDGGLEWVNSHF
jgi:hypothetical protein